MRSTHFSVLLLPFTTSALQIPSIFAPFTNPHLESNDTIIPNEHELLKRDGTCPTNYNSCSTLAAADAGACCTVGSFCTTDHAKNIACCPTGATCTGSLTRASSTDSTTGAVLGGGGTTTTSGSVTTTTSTGTTITTTGTATLSYVSNAYFPFPYIPTTYSNSAACNSAYLDCQSNYAACTAALEGGSGFGVTISAPAGGTTVVATGTSLPAASATSICSSLSVVGCYSIQSSNCAQFATGFVVGATSTGGAMEGRYGGRERWVEKVVKVGVVVGIVVGGLV